MSKNSDKNHITVKEMSKMDASDLQDVDSKIYVHDDDNVEILAVIVPYEDFIALQRKILDIMELMNSLSPL